MNVTNDVVDKKFNETDFCFQTFYFVQKFAQYKSHNFLNLRPQYKFFNQQNVKQAEWIILT